MAVSNPYTSQAIAGYNSSPPPDDGSLTAANKLEWDKHKTKLGDPVKTLAEAVNSEALAAFGQLVITDDPAQETAIQVMEEFLSTPPFAGIASRARISANLDPNENALVMISEFI